MRRLYEVGSTLAWLGFVELENKGNKNYYKWLGQEGFKFNDDLNGLPEGGTQIEEIHDS